jgi:iron complex outermembrane receptor protein
MKRIRSHKTFGISMHHATFRRSALSAAIALLAASQAHAQAAAAASPAASAAAEQVVVITASADASAGGLKAPYAGGQVARGGRVGLLGSQDVMDTPFTITNYTSKLIQDQQAISLADVLQNDPAVRVTRGFGNFQQAYMVRGLVVYSDDISYNGLYGLLPRQYLAAELVERVEVLRGASAFLNGAAPGGSGLGGAVNVMPKRAANAPQAEFTLGIDGGQVSETLDIGRRFGAQKNLGLRANIVHRDGDTAVKGENNKLDAALLGADLHLGGLRVSADLGSQDHLIQGATPNINVFGAVPVAPRADKQIAQPWSYSHERDTFGTLRAEVDLLPSLTAWAAGGFREGHEDNQLEAVTINGATAAQTLYGAANSRKDSIKTGELGVRGTFATGLVKHTLVASVGAYQAVSKNAFAFSNFGGVPAGTLYDTTAIAIPDETYYTGGSNLAHPLTTLRVLTSSEALADTMAFADGSVLLTLGARRQQIESTSFDYGTGAQSTPASKAARVTPVTGLVFKLNKQVSLFGTYIEGLVAGDVVPETWFDSAFASHQYANRGESFKPYQTRQGEIGIKVDTGSYGGTVSVFRSSKPSYGLIANADNPDASVFGLISKQTNRGAELSVYGEAMPGVRVLGGASFLDARLAGRDVIGSPRSQYNLGLDFDVPSVLGLALDVRGVHTAKQFADSGNTLVVPAWTRFDVGARYTIDVGAHAVTLRGGVNNVTNRNYWGSAGGYPGQGYLTVGAPRTFVFSGTFSY